MGWVAYDLGDYPQARAHFARALEIREALGAKAGIAESLRGLGEVEGTTGAYHKAREYLVRAVEIYDGIGLQHESQPIQEKLRSLEEEMRGRQ